jgi:drug/metabolite transporter (DMT)-like permease
VAAVSSFIVALQVVPLADITAIYQVAPLFVLAGASFIWRENVGLLRWVLIVTGLVGALVVAQPGQDGASPLALLGFITAIAAAARDLLSRKVPADTPGLVITFNVIVMVFVMATLYNWLFEGWTPVPLSVWAYGLGAGFFVVLGQLFVFLAFRFAAARSVVPFYYASIVFAAAFGAVFFAEYPNALALSGMAMIIVCGVGVLYFEDGEKQA